MNRLLHLKNGLLMLGIVVLIMILVMISRQHHWSTVVANSTSEPTTTTTTKSTVKILNYDLAQKSFNETLNSINGYKQYVDCERVVRGNFKDLSLRKKAEAWSFNDVEFWNSFGTKPNICAVIKSTFTFATEPMSQEEHDFPLAYSFLVHDNAVQVLFLLSSLYQPQNQFCIAVDESTNDEFKRQMLLIGECFPNIFVMLTPKVHWCGFTVLQGVFQCVEYLAKLREDWRYYQVRILDNVHEMRLIIQYLSGVDLPLKTNLEMVRIFKKLNGSFNAGIYDLPDNRFRYDVSPPVPLWKSSLSATFSRESANFMVHHPLVEELYEYLKTTLCPDETFWTSIAGNPHLLAMPGGFDANLWKQKLTGEWDQKHATNTTKLLSKNRSYSLFVPEKYYISRYQVWYTSNYRKLQYKCFGRFAAESCVFGVGDLSILVNRPELIAHKFYHNVQPAAYFCLYEHIRRRAFKADTNFNVDAYGELPGPKLLAGTPFEEVEFNAPGGYEFY